MAIARDTTAKNIKPLQGAKVRRFTAGATISPGEIVSMASDGKVDPANATDITLATALGIALGTGDMADTDPVDVVTEGPVLCVTGGTPGKLAYVSDTAGEPAETAGTKVSVVGIVESATVIYVRPFQTVFS